jgi:putative hemolysin
MVISAQIIDLDALDQALLISNAPVTSSVARSAQADTSQARSADQARDFLSNYASQSPVPARAGDYGSILQRMVDRSPAQPVEASLAAANIRYYLQKGREAEASQRLQAARVYYRLAQEAMTPEIHLRYQQVVDQRQQAAEGQRKDAADDKLQF